MRNRCSPRRQFLVHAGRAALATTVFSSLACSRRREAQDTRVDASSPDPAAAPIAELEKRIPGWMAEASVPGLSIAFIKDAKLVWSGGFGIADVRSQVPIDTATIFDVGSVSKTVFAYAVMQLVERKVLGLDAPLTSYTDEPFLSGDERLSRMTARHVLSHSGGFQNWRSERAPLRIHFEPGEQYLYSGEGYSYLQSVVTTLTGRRDPTDCARFEAGVEVCSTDFDAFMRTSVLAPLGMTSSGYLLDGTAPERFAAPHDERGQRLDRSVSAPAVSVARYGAAGGLKTTPADYARFLIDVIDPRPGDAFRLEPETVKEMLRPHVKLPPPAQPPASYALGWQIWHFETDDIINHGGDNLGFRAFAAASVERKSGFVVMMNGNNGFRVLDRLLTDDNIGYVV